MNTMQWVKAAIRLPGIKEGDFDRVFVRQISNGYKDCVSVKYLSIHQKWYEWLDESASGGGMREALEEIAKGQQGELKGEFINRIIKLAKAALETTDK